jgi:anti-sigma factor ChrR (cupin superfamily)
MSLTIHGDLSARVVVDTRSLPWTPSPSGTVWRKRLHLVGPPESGQVTSLVRFEDNSSFHQHDHPEGEEVLVLEGVFSDEYGDWPAGSYLLNPEGFRHAPFSHEGCLLFVKLRQFPGRDRVHIAMRTEGISCQPNQLRATRQLYAQAGYVDATRLEGWSPGSILGDVDYPNGAELFVLRGAFEDEYGAYGQYTWLRFPLRSTHHPRTTDGCCVYIKEGGLAYLRGG